MAVQRKKYTNSASKNPDITKENSTRANSGITKYILAKYKYINPGSREITRTQKVSLQILVLQKPIVHKKIDANLSSAVKTVQKKKTYIYWVQLKVENVNKQVNSPHIS